MVAADFLLKCLQRGARSSLLNQDLLGLIYLEHEIPLLSCLVGIFGVKSMTILEISKLAQQLDLSCLAPCTYLRYIVEVDFIIKAWIIFQSKTNFYILEYLENTEKYKKAHKNHQEASSQRITRVNTLMAIFCASPHHVPLHTPSFRKQIEVIL